MKTKIISLAGICLFTSLHAMDNQVPNVGQANRTIIGILTEEALAYHNKNLTITSIQMEQDNPVYKKQTLQDLTNPQKNSLKTSKD